MKKQKFNVKVLLVFSAIALLYSIVMAQLNNPSPGSGGSFEERLVFGLLIGFVSCLVFLIGCVFMYTKVAGISVGRGILGALVLAPIIFYILFLVIYQFHNLDYLSRPQYNKAGWIFALMLYFSSNIISMLLIRQVLNNLRKKKDRMDRITGRTII